MAEILLFSGHRREALLRRGSIGGGGFARGISPLHIFFFGFDAKLVHFQSLFFSFLCSSWIKIKPITKIFWPALATE